jgi:hypothetical protein
MSSNNQTPQAHKSRLTPLVDYSQSRGQTAPEAPSEKPFPLDALPVESQKIISEVARVSFAPQNLVAAQSLAWMAAALGKGAISVSGSYQTFPNLFILGVSATGTGKSQSASYLQKPFNLQLNSEVDSWNSRTRPKIEIRMREIEQRKKAIDKRARKDEGKYTDASRKEMEEIVSEQSKLLGGLKAPRFVVEDVTQEALADALSSFDGSLILFSTDAGKVLSNLHGRYNATKHSGPLREDTFFLKGYSVESFVIDRVSKSQSIEEPCLTALLLIQPNKLKILFGDEGLCDGGFMPRMMPCLTPVGLPERSPQAPIEQAALSAWEKLVNGLFRLRKSGGGVGNKSRVRFQVSEEASKAWYDWDNANRKKTNLGTLTDVSSFVSRWGEWAQRIAVNLQAAKFVANNTNETIARETMNDAIQIAEWFVNEQLRILHEGRMAAHESKEESLKQRAKKLESDLEKAGKEKSLADLGRRNGFLPEEVHELCKRFPEKFEIREKRTYSKSSTVCVLV